MNTNCDFFIWLNFGLGIQQSNLVISIAFETMFTCIMLSFGIICQPYGGCNYQHIFYVYITWLHLHLNGITNYLEVFFFDKQTLIFF
jgi:hypothetical protein